MKRRKPNYTILRDLRNLIEKYENECAAMGILGQGCIHVRIDFDLETMVVSRAEFLRKLFGPELREAVREFQSIWDLSWKMNRGATSKKRQIKFVEYTHPSVAAT